MTREEARLYADSYMGVYGGRLVDEIVQTIFDEFESRTCENCKYIKGKDKTSECVFGYLPDNMYEYDFGCNKWEKRDD